MPGRIVLLCALLLFLYSLMSMRMPIYALSFPLAGILVTDFVIGFVMRPRIVAERHLPQGIGVNSEAPITYTLTNRGRRPAWNVEVDSLPLPPGIRFTQGLPIVKDLPPGQSIKVTGHVASGHRGKYPLPAVRTSSVFPFNIWRWGTISGRPQNLLVYPSFTPLASLEMPGGRSYTPGGVSLASHVADSTEFFGCREYRGGDNPRHIHWRSWARTGYPVTREFHEEYYARAAVILDTYTRKGYRLQQVGIVRENIHFEAAVSIAAAIGDFLARREYVVDLFAAGPHIFRFQSGRSLAHFSNILDVLACLEPHREEPFAELAPEIFQEIANINSAILILMRWDQTRRNLLQQLLAAGTQVKTILVSEPGARTESIPDTITLLDTNDVRNGRCTRL